MMEHTTSTRVLLAMAVLMHHTDAAPGKSALACSLNGVLAGTGTDTACKCDLPWKGDTCDKLDILPRKTGAVPAYGACACALHRVVRVMVTAGAGVAVTVGM